MKDREQVSAHLSEGEPVPTTPEQALRNIEEHIKDADLKSPRFQAFANLVDIINPSLPVSNRIANRMSYNRDLIYETIRQSINGVEGYKGEFEEAHRLIDDYRKSLGHSDFRGNFGLDNKWVDIEKLTTIKDRAIDAKSKPPLKRVTAREIIMGKLRK